MGNTSSKGPFSIAVLVYQRVIRVLFWSDVEKTGMASSMSNFEFLVSNHLIWQVTHRWSWFFLGESWTKITRFLLGSWRFFCTQTKQNMTEFDKKSFERSPRTSRCILWFGVLGIFFGGPNKEPQQVALDVQGPVQYPQPLFHKSCFCLSCMRLPQKQFVTLPP